MDTWLQAATAIVVRILVTLHCGTEYGCLAVLKYVMHTPIEGERMRKAHARTEPANYEFESILKVGCKLKCDKL